MCIYPFKLATRKVFILFFPILLCSTNVFSQLNDIGFGLGGFNATGDITKRYYLKNLRPAGNVFFRTNISDALGLRYGIMGGWLEGKNRIDSDTAGISSFNLSLLEASVLLEYHFLDYKSKHSRVHWTPLLYFGAGLFMPIGNLGSDLGYSRIQPTIPLGFGVKYKINPKFDIGLEASSRITFFDYLDRVADYDPRFRYGNKYNFDVYYFVGFTLYYTFYMIPCPYGYD